MCDLWLVPEHYQSVQRYFDVQDSLNGRGDGGERIFDPIESESARSTLYLHSKGDEACCRVQVLAHNLCMDDKDRRYR